MGGRTARPDAAPTPRRAPRQRIHLQYLTPFPDDRHETPQAVEIFNGRVDLINACLFAIAATR